jgi:hypothetical protein
MVMSRSRLVCAAATLVVLATATASRAAVNPDGSLQVISSLAALPAPVAGQPLFDRRADGHLQVGLTERGRDGGKATPSQDAGIVSGMGGTMMRVPINWAHVQPTSSPQYTWGPSDDMYAALVQRGIRPIFPVQSAPTWAVPGCPAPAGECHQPPDTVSARDAYSQLLAAIAQRYPLAAAIEVWNEPNNSFGSELGPDPVAYAQLLAASYDAVKAARPAMRVLGGALGNYGAGGPGQVTDSHNMRLDEYLAAMEDNGAATHMDGLSFHPYPASSAANPSNNFYRAFSYIAAVLDAKGDAGRRLVPDEIGLTSNSISEESTQSTTLQARYHDLDAPASSTVAKAAQVDGVIFHTDVNNIDFDKYGWVEPLSLSLGFRPHAVWCAFGQMLAGLSGCPATISP